MVEYIVNSLNVVTIAILIIFLSIVTVLGCLGIFEGRN